MSALNELEITRFEDLTRAVHTGNVALLKLEHRETGEEHALAVLALPDGLGGHNVYALAAILTAEDPLADYIPPDGTVAVSPDSQEALESYAGWSDQVDSFDPMFEIVGGRVFTEPELTALDGNIPLNPDGIDVLGADPGRDA